MKRYIKIIFKINNQNKVIIHSELLFALLEEKYFFVLLFYACGSHLLKTINLL